MYKQVLTPNKQNHTIEMPEQFFGKKVEVIVVEINDPAQNNKPEPPAGKKIVVNELFENFGTAPNFPTIDEIRTKAWDSKW